MKGGPGTLRHTAYRFDVVMNHSKPQNRYKLCDGITTSLCSHSPSSVHWSTESILQRQVCNYNIYMKEGRASRARKSFPANRETRPCGRVCVARRA